VTYEVQPAEPAVSDKPKRRWYQFSLGALLALMTIICVYVASWQPTKTFGIPSVIQAVHDGVATSARPGKADRSRSDAPRSNVARLPSAGV